MVEEYRNSDALPGKKVHFQRPNKPIPKPIASMKDDPIVLWRVVLVLIEATTNEWDLNNNEIDKLLSL